MINDILFKFFNKEQEILKHKNTLKEIVYWMEDHTPDLLEHINHQEKFMNSILEEEDKGLEGYDKELFEYCLGNNKNIEISKVIVNAIKESEKEIEDKLKNILSENLSIEVPVDKRKFKDIERQISKSNRIVIVRHVAPDADAIGSARALYEGIKERYTNKEVILANESTEITLTEKDLLIICDLAVESRIAGKIYGNPFIVRFDHHPGNNIKANVDVSDINAGSACELVTLFLIEQKYNINKDSAENLFKGIITDTGRLQYSMSKTTMVALNYLVGLGVDFKQIYSQLYVKNPVQVRTKAYLLNNYKRMPNGTVYLFMDYDIAKRERIDLDSLSSELYELGTIKNSPIWVLLLDRGKGSIKMSIRSRGIDIRPVAERFGGGGHQNASGVSVNSRAEAKEVLIALDNYLRDKKGTLVESEFSDDLNAMYPDFEKESPEDLKKERAKEREIIKDIIDVTKDITYGFISKLDNSRIDDRDWIHGCNELKKYYDVELDPEKTLERKLGICTDQSIVLRYLLNKYHPERIPQLYALMKGRYGHCVTTYKTPEGKYYYYENAWDKENGPKALHGPFNSEKELQDYLYNLYTNAHKDDTDEPTIVEKYAISSKDYKDPNDVLAESIKFDISFKE